MKRNFPFTLFSILFILAAALNACAPKADPPTPSPEPAVENTSAATVTSSPTATMLPAPSAVLAILSEIAGRVETKQANQEAFAPAEVNSYLDENGQAMTGSDGRVRMDLSTGTIVRLAPDSLFTLVLNEPSEGSLKTRIQMAFGELFVILNGGSLEVETPTGTAAVRGSFMSVSYDPTSGEIRITCLEGHCSLGNASGNVDITAGQTAVITGAGQPPQTGTMTQEDIQNWLANNPEARIIVDALFSAKNPTAIPPSGGYIPPAVVAKPKGEGETAATSTPAPTLVPTVSIGNVAPTSSLVGEPLVVGVNVSPSGGGPMPTGTVKVRAGANYFCSATLDSAGNAICSGGIPSAGAHDLTADYLGDTSYLPASSPSWIEFSVSQASTVTTLNPPLPSLAATAVTFTATVDVLSPGAGTPYGSVTFTDGSVTTYCTDTAAPWECTYTFGTAGPYMVQANYSGDANFIGSLNTITHHVLSGTDTEFSNQNGPTGTIAICSPAYQVQALDIAGVSGVQVEYRIGDNIFVGTDLKENLTWNVTTQLWEGSFIITALNTETAYWRFIATDAGGNKTFMGNGITYVNGYTGSPVDSYSFTGPGCP